MKNLSQSKMTKKQTKKCKNPKNASKYDLLWYKIEDNKTKLVFVSIIYVKIYICKDCYMQ